MDKPSRSDYEIRRVGVIRVEVFRDGRKIHIGTLSDTEAKYQIDYDLQRRRKKT